jgi:hypothetical protein
MADAMIEAADSAAVLSALPQQISSHRAVLGYLGTAMEWDEADRCRDYVGVGQADDLEGASSGRRAQPQSLPKRHCIR